MRQGICIFRGISCGSRVDLRPTGAYPDGEARQSRISPPCTLVRFAAAIAQGYEPELRERAAPLKTAQVPVPWVEELLLQSVLMVGYPRTLIAFGVWRKVGRVPAPPMDPDADYKHGAGVDPTR